MARKNWSICIAYGRPRFHSSTCKVPQAFLGLTSALDSHRVWPKKQTLRTDFSTLIFFFQWLIVTSLRWCWVFSWGKLWAQLLAMLYNSPLSLWKLECRCLECSFGNSLHSFVMFLSWTDFQTSQQRTCSRFSQIYPCPSSNLTSIHNCSSSRCHVLFARMLTNFMLTAMNEV